MPVQLNPEVVALVRRELSKPKAGPTDGKALKEQAEKIDPSIKSLSIFAFSGRYLRHVQEQLGGAKKTPAKKTGATKGGAKKSAPVVAKKAAATKPAPAAVKKAVAKKAAPKKVPKTATAKKTPGNAPAKTGITAKAPSAKKGGRRLATAQKPVRPLGKVPAGAGIAARKAGRPAGATASMPNRKRLRDMMIKLAQDVGGASGNPAKLVTVIDSIDNRLTAALR